MYCGVLYAIFCAHPQCVRYGMKGRLGDMGGGAIKAVKYACMQTGTMVLWGRRICRQ
jgi:hypothetical protein